MKSLFGCIAMMFICSIAYAQSNLVLNPSFEEYLRCPDFIDEAKYCTGWSSLDTAWNPPDWANDKGGVPEYCNVCASSYYVSVPRSLTFYHEPRTGNGFMHVELGLDVADNTSVARNYLQGHLSSQLSRGHEYVVSFFATLAQAGAYATDNLGAYLDDGSIDTTRNPGWTQFQWTPQIVSTVVIKDTTNWVKIQGVFNATGNEKFITIGNFARGRDNHFVALRDTSGSTSGNPTWYLIDDVGVFECAGLKNLARTYLIHPGDSAFLGISEPLAPYKWYQLGSTVPIDSGGGIWVHPTRTTSYVVRQDLCKSQQWDTVTVRVWPDTVTGVAFTQLHEMQMYPNPSHGSLTITGAKGILVSVVDVLGNCVLPQFVAAEPEVLDLVLLAKGVYVVRFTDRVTGEVMVRKVVKE